MNKLTIFTAYNTTKKQLSGAGIEDFALEARYIMRHITGYDNTKIMANYMEELTPLQQTVLKNMVSRRMSGYPLQYILGVWQFYGLDFYVGEGVLVPRPDTETLVRRALEFLEGKPNAKILDLCAGSGCIGIAVAKNSGVKGVAVEKYQKAYSYLEKNIKRHSVDLTPVLADVLEYKTNDKFDLIVANPPYISEDELALMNKETSFEPREALFAEDNGLFFYKKIAALYKEKLTAGGMLAVEIGFSQAEAVKQIFKENGYTDIGVDCDYSGNQRVVFCTVK